MKKFEINADYSIDLKLKACVVVNDDGSADVDRLSVHLDNEAETRVSVGDLGPFRIKQGELAEEVLRIFDDHFCTCGRKRYLWSSHQDEVREVED